MWPFFTFSRIKEEFFDSSTPIYICLHSTSDLSALVYTRLVTRLHFSIFVYGSSTFAYNRLMTRLCFKNRSLMSSNFYKIFTSHAYQCKTWYILQFFEPHNKCRKYRKRITRSLIIFTMPRKMSNDFLNHCIFVRTFHWISSECTFHWNVRTNK